MALQWDDSLATGIEKIDAQHRSMLEAFSRLSTAAQNGEAEELVGELTRFLIRYCQEHFASEEQLMGQYEYPQLLEHQKQHYQFTRDTQALAKEIADHGVSRELAIVTTGRLARWIINHIRKEDQTMGAFIRAAQGR